ncbi:hypothetical protein Tco_0621960, partial [Tanacetum coccineum]
MEPWMVRPRIVRGEHMFPQYVVAGSVAYVLEDEDGTNAYSYGVRWDMKNSE